MKKGFTLIELLVVIALLAIIAVLVSTSVIGIMEKSRSSLSKTQINRIEDAAEQWATVNPDKIPLDSATYELDIQTLSNEGFIDSADLENPEDGKNLCGIVEISYDSSHNQYKYEFKEKEC